MLLYLFGRFIKFIFYPLINDSEISIDKKGYKIRSLFIVCFHRRYQILKRTHNHRNKIILIEYRKQISAIIYKFCQIRLLSLPVISSFSVIPAEQGLALPSCAERLNYANNRIFNLVAGFATFLQDVWHKPRCAVMWCCRGAEIKYNILKKDGQQRRVHWFISQELGKGNLRVGKK
jgi:hypothetical protein